MSAQNRIDYVEIPVTDLKRTREFFSSLFGWSFQEWGDEYMSFNDGRLDGGFRLSPEPALQPVCCLCSSAKTSSVTLSGSGTSAQT